jgi:excisionase family DNA binding protein
MDYRRLMDVAAAAKVMDVHPATLYRWARQRKIPCVRMGSRVIRFDPDALNRYISKNSVEVQEAAGR